MQAATGQPKAPVRRGWFVVAAVLCAILGPVSYILLVDQPLVRRTGASLFIFSGLAVLLSAIALLTDRRKGILLGGGLSLLFGAAPAALFLLTTGVTDPGGSTLQVGAAAPAFTLPDQDGKPRSLVDEVAQGPLLLVFYRGHWWLVCVAELRGLGVVHEELQRRGGKLLAVSVDTPAEARAVVDKARLPFSILSDTSREMIRGYGLVHTGGGRDGSDIAKPATVLIGGDGRVRWMHVGRTVVDRPDTAALLAALADLTK